jgi:hypothetical protein
LLAAHLILTGLPLAAVALFAARRGIRDVPLLLAIGLAASGAVGILGFWSFYGDRLIGEAFSYFVLFGSVLLIGWSLYGGHLDQELLRRLGTPLVLWGLGSAFLVLLGFVHGGTEAPLATAASRFSHPLPTDAEIPNFFAEWFFQHGHHGLPPIFPGEWLASDRPPLQMGYVLSQRSLGGDSQLSYQVLGVVLQQLWIVGLWALLVAARAGRLTRALAVIAVLLSDLAIVNGFFVWPKMLPAAMLLAVAALVITPMWQRVRRSLWAAALIGLLCALAMLGHGSSVFGIIPLAALAAYRGLPSWGWVGVALAVGVVLMAPWSAYQKYGDPPGNRLTKWTLAGVVEIDSRSTSEALIDSYSEAGVGGVLHDKAENFATMSGGTMAPNALRAALDTGKIVEVIRALRAVFFFYLLPSIGVLLLAPVAMVMGRRRRLRNSDEWSFALACFAVFVIGAVVWGLALFGNGNDRTLVHVGTYLLPLLGICGAVVGLRSVFPRFAIYIVGFTAIFSLALYTPSLDPLPASVYSPLAAALAAASLAGFVVVALRRDSGREPRHSTPA